MLNASMIYARSGDNTNALALLQKALKAEPQNSMVNFNLAPLEAELEKMEACQTHLRAALKVDPQMAQAAYNLGVLLCQKNDPEGFQWLETATRLIPENWNYASSLIFFLQRDNRTAEIETVLKEAVASNRAAPEAYFTLIGNYLRDGRTAQALEICKKAKHAKHLPMDAKRYATQMEQQINLNGNHR